MQQQFNVGDRVRLVRSMYPENIGVTGTIEEFKDFSHWVRVVWDRPIDGHDWTTGVELENRRKISLVSLHQIEHITEETAPPTLIETVSKEQIMTKTKLRYSQHPYTIESDRLERQLRAGTLLNLAFLAVAIIGAIAGAYAFADLVEASNNIVEIIKNK